MCILVAPSFYRRMENDLSTRSGKDYVRAQTRDRRNRRPTLRLVSPDLTVCRGSPKPPSGKDRIPANSNAEKEQTTLTYVKPCGGQGGEFSMDIP